jgi:hypothetical protein
MDLPDVDTALAWRGRTVVDAQGEELGKVSALYLDAESQRPAWAGVKRGGLLPGRETLVPLAGAEEVEGGVRIAHDRTAVEGAPDVDPDVELSEDEERVLYEHYGQAWAPTESEDEETGSVAAGDAGAEPETDGTAGPDSAPEPASAGDAAAGDGPVEVVRSEEEVELTTRVKPQAERVRLRKVVVEDEVTQTIPVRKEVVQVETDPPPEGTIESVEDVDDQRS